MTRTTSLPPPLPPLVLDVRAAAALLGIAPRTLRALVARGSGPPRVRVGGRPMYRLADLLDYVATLPPADRPPELEAFTPFMDGQDAD
jgi:hypothetical protein